MKIIVSQESLAEALGSVSRVVPSKSTLPVLSNVLLAATADGYLTITANNLELAIESRIQVTVEREGRITLPARMLTDYVGELDHGQRVTIDVNPKTYKAHLECGRYKATMSGIDAEDFPPIPTASGGTTASLPADQLRGLIEQVVYAAAPDDSRPVLAGVLVRVLDGTLTLAAADGFRLAVRSVELPDGSPDFTVIVPSKSLSEVGRLLPKDKTVAVRFEWSANHVVFGFLDTSITSRLIDGQFPDYSRIMPGEASTRVTIGVPALLRAVRASQVFAKDNSMIVRFEATVPEDGAQWGKFRVKATSAEMGDNVGDLDAVVEGTDGSIAFNGRYVRDALEALESDSVLVSISGSASPGLMEPVGGTDDYKIVIMPMHVGR